MLCEDADISVLLYIQYIHNQTDPFNSDGQEAAPRLT